MSDDLGRKAVGAAKWSLATQVASKLITPVTQMVLAHILAPEAFGVVALVTMVTSFADLFSDAGFQKYIVQHEYREGESPALSCDVAFWTNLALSLALWGAIALARDPLAAALGDPSIGAAIAAACASLPLTAAVSVQTAVYQRAFDFRTLFWSRVGSALLVMLVSVPLALLGLGYWSMVWGTVASNLFLAAWLTARSPWKPSARYSLAELGRMLSFSAWTLAESLSVWATSWAGAFVLGAAMDTYHLGLYNTSVSLVNSVVGIVSGAVNPVAFSALSRMQGDRARFDEAFYRMQKYLGVAVAPVAACLFVFSDAAVGLLLGEQWLEASGFLGLYSLASAFVVVFGHIASDAYRALGRPRLSLLAQLGFLAFLVPTLVVGARLGWETFTWLVPLGRLAGSLATHFLICRVFVGISPWRMVTGLGWVYLATALTAAPCWAAVQLLDLGHLAQCALLPAAALLYLALVLAFRDTRATVLEIAGRFGLDGMLARALPRSLARRWGLRDGKEH